MRDNVNGNKLISTLSKGSQHCRHSLPSQHPDVIQIEKDIQRVSSNLK